MLISGLRVLSALSYNLKSQDNMSGYGGTKISITGSSHIEMLRTRFVSSNTRVVTSSVIIIRSARVRLYTNSWSGVFGLNFYFICTCTVHITVKQHK